MTESRKKVRFWPMFGITFGVDIFVVLLYTLIGPGLTGRALSDSLCMSAIPLAFVATLPVLFDMGRGIGMAGKIGTNDEERYAALEHERRRREYGMTITFAFAAATLIIALLSVFIGLL